MKIAIALLSATAAITLPAFTFAADQTADVNSSVQYKDNGGYNSSASAKQTDANGTTTTAKQTEDVDVDNNGNTTKHTKKVTTTDPKGMMNEKTKLTDVKTEDKSNGGYKKTVESKSTDNSSNGTNIDSKTTTDVSLDKNGNVTKTITAKKTVDPKTGLFSAQTTTSKTKTVNGQVVDQSQSAPNPSSDQ